ncbi:MAG: TlpA family protein disulfide reductase [Armatimonadetes bacterium]|nr:TlpA family protein disulfide reductase [Armatimonadota bacterium]
MKPSALLKGALASLSLAGIIGCNPAPQQTEAPPATGSPQAPPATGTPTAQVSDSTLSGPAAGTLAPGRPAPDFSLPTVRGGETVKLSDTAGKVRLVAFWSTTCIPCIKELPVLQAIQKTYGDQGFQVLYLSADPPELQKPFLEKRNVKFPSLIADNKTLEVYDAAELPKMALVNGEGRILKEYTGETAADILEADVKTALAQAG